MKILYFDYCAIAIQAILLFTTIHRGLTKGRLNKCFLELLALGVISTIADIVSAYADNNCIPLMSLRYASHCLYLLSHNMNTPLYILYLMMITDTDYKLRSWKSILYSLPLGSVVVLMIINPFTHLIYSIDDSFIYRREKLFFVLYLSAASYMIIGVIFLIRYAKTIGFRRALGIGCVIPFMGLAIILQYFNPNLLLEMFGNTIALLLISGLIHRPEDILDTITGLSNRSSCIDVFNRCIKNKKPLAFVTLSLTNYASIQELIGYDRITKFHKIITSKIIAVTKQKNCFSEMFYIGNGHYAFEMDYRILDETEKTADQINHIFSEPIEIDGMEIGLTPIVCIVNCPTDISDGETFIRFVNSITSEKYSGKVMRAADLYQHSHFDLMRDIDSIIENAITHKLFKVYYQPIYSIKDKHFNSAEALIRLFDDKYGFISPELFIPAAERSGAIHRIGAFVLDEVCRFISSEDFKKLGIDYIEVNLSVAQCMRNDLSEEILDIMKRHNVSSESINLEITETAASYSQENLVENMNELSASGISFSLDDYGTGYSNMDRVSSMQFDIIKLDKSFVNAKRNHNRDIVLSHTVSMIKEMGMKIVVEGIETKELLEHFADLGCDYIQGYYFSKPVPKDDFVSFIRKNNIA